MLDYGGKEEISVPYKIKKARLSCHMTQEELAQKAGISRATISSLENGTAKTTTVDTLTKLAKALGVAPGELFFP